LKLEKNEILQRYNDLSPRDRLLLWVGAVIILLYGGYQIIFLPLAGESVLLEQKIKSQQQTYHYLQQISTEVVALRQSGVSATPEAEDLSPMTVIDSSSQQLEIKPAIKRLLPEGADKVTIWLENLAFDKLIVWLAILETKHQLKVIQIDVDRQADAEGLVNAKVLLGN